MGEVIRPTEEEWEKERRTAEERAGKKPQGSDSTAPVGVSEWQMDREVAEQRTGTDSASTSERPAHDQPISEIRQPD